MASGEEYLRLFLAGRDVACPLCGYNLRDLASERCPECGERVEVGLRMADVRQGAWVAGIVGLSTMLGFNLLMLVVMNIQLLLRPGPRGAVLVYLAMFGIGAGVAGAGLLAWLRFRRAVLTARPLTRRLLVPGCWMIGLLNVVLLLVIDHH